MLYNRAHFSLWSAANHRLQARQILLQEEPSLIQSQLISKLDLGRPEIRICSDVLQMTTLVAAAKQLTPQQGSAEHVPTQSAAVVTDHLQAMQELIDRIEIWTAEVDSTWKPTSVDVQSIARPMATDHPLAYFSCSDFFTYSDIWVAFIWDFHAACQIILREAFIELARYGLQVSDPVTDDDDVQSSMKQQQTTITSLATNIIKSTPSLMSFATDGLLTAPLQGITVGRCLALFALQVVQKARFTSLEHKRMASKAIEWVQSQYTLP
jgi:hypothetical protein